MKHIIILILISFPLVTQAQFNDHAVQLYANKVFEKSQGFIEVYGELEGTPYALGYANEHLSFSRIRTIVNRIAAANSNVIVLHTWQKQRYDTYTHVVVIDRKYVVNLSYYDGGRILILYSIMNE